MRNGLHCLSVKQMARTLLRSEAWEGAIMGTVFLLLALLTGAVTANAAALEPPQGRLPDNVTPTAYRLDLTVDPSRARFSGHTEIDALLAQPSTVIYLHGNGLRVTRARVTAGTRTVTARYAEVDPTGVARLELSRAVPAGKITLQFDYSSGFRDTAEGLYHARVGSDWYAWTQMEPIDARRMFPGFDEPGFKTPFTVTITAPKGAKAFANAPEIGASPSGSMVIHHFSPSKPLPTYLIAIGVGPFDVVETTVPPNAARKEPLAFRVIATRGQSARMQFTAVEAPKLLGLLERYFGSPYPYEKLDFLASPLFFGAMENAGLIVFRDSLILLDNDAPLRQLRSFAEVSAHEMAHQWFGDLVTPTWWTDLWLNESFAEWMGKKIADQWRPDLGIAASELSDAFDAMDSDALGHGRPIHQEITRSTQIHSTFDSITYEKGAQVLSMFESYLGPDTFAKGVRLHLDRHRYGSATADDFFQALGDAADNPKVVPAMRTFTEQTGIPMVTVGDGAQSVVLAQARYRPLGVEAGAVQLWMIPMCLSRGEAPSCTLLETRTATIGPLVGSGHALMPDAGATGYYRFSLDGAGWDRLIAAGADMPGREAMAVANNLWANFVAGEIDFGHVIAGARALSGNPERLAAIELGNRLKSISDTMLTAEQRPGYRRLMGSIYGPRLTALGTDLAAGAYAGEGAQRQALRQSLLLLVALEARDPELRAQLVSAVRAYFDGNAHALDPAFRAVALQVAVQEGDAAFLTRLKDAMLESSDPLFKMDANLAIGSGDAPRLADAALKIATSPGVDAPVAARIFFYSSAQPGSRETTTTFIQNNFPRVMELYPGFARPFIVTLFDGYCDTDAAANVDAFFQPRLQVMGGGELELAKAKERIRLCAALKSARGTEIARAFAN
jgi:aminopeptidase N